MTAANVSDGRKLDTGRSSNMENALEYDAIASGVFAPLYPVVAEAILERIGVVSGRMLDGDLPGSDKISLLCSLDVRLGADGGYVAHPIDFRQSSSARTAAANAQYMTSLGGPPPRAGDRIVVELLREPGSIVRS
mgnify:CR=1 FL=1